MEEKIRVLLVDKNPQTLEVARKTLLQHSPDLDIETNVTKDETVSFRYVPDVIVKNISNGNGSGLKMSFVFCKSFFQQPASFLSTVIQLVCPTRLMSNREKNK